MTQQDDSIWRGRDDSGEQGDTTRLFQVVRRATDHARGDAVLLGFASDAGVRRLAGRHGRDAPDSRLAGSRAVPGRLGSRPGLTVERERC